MGRFIEEKKVINQYVETYLDSTDKYSKYFEGTPTFTTYYSKDNTKSTEDIGLGGAIEIVGLESPIRYNKIENFPIYDIEEIQPSLEIDDELGIKTEMESTALVLPNTIKPLPDDLLIISYNSIPKIFRVTNVETGNFSNKVYYKITFFITSYDPSMIDKNQLSDEYDVVLENLGSNNKLVIPKKDALLLDDIEREIEKMSERYIKYFYNKNLNSFVIKQQTEEGKIFGEYDPLISRFFYNTKLFIDIKTFLKNIYIDELLEVDDDIYEESIFHAIETRNIENLNAISYFKESLKQSIFAIYRDCYYQRIYFPSKMDGFGEGFIANGENLKIYLEEHISDINPIHEVIIRYLLGENKVEDVLSLVQKVKIKQESISYTLIPCIIFILKHLKNNIIKLT